ncbi:glycosyltransferase [Vibrio breoganii]
MKKVLLVMGGLDAGGAEKWALDFCNKLKELSYSVDVLCHENKPYFFEKEFKDLGVNIIKFSGHKNPIKYLNSINKLVKLNGYDVIHSHVNHFSSLICLSKFFHLKRIIVHCHNDLSVYKKNASFAKKLYYIASELIINRLANERIAVSEIAAKSLFSPGYELIYCGVNFNKLKEDVKVSQIDESIRTSLTGKKNIFHVGRFVHQKNHEFILSLAKESKRQGYEFQFVLLGDGELFDFVKSRVVNEKIDNILMLGAVHNVAALLYEYAYLNILPSHHEGLPITLMECQALGVKSIVSSKVSHESSLSDDLVDFLDISNEEAKYEWLDKISLHSRESNVFNENFINSKFDIDRSALKVIALYEN